LIDDYGALEKQRATQEEVMDTKRTSDTPNSADPKEEKKPQETLMQTEERNTGAVSGATYRKYLQYAGRLGINALECPQPCTHHTLHCCSLTWGPLIFAFLVLGQCSTIANQLFLGKWTSLDDFGKPIVDVPARFLDIANHPRLYSRKIYGCLLSSWICRSTLHVCN
jgi:ATP-binding cassette, subfamily C (CFTR/MRP), member 1